MGSFTVLLEVDAQFVDARVQSNTLFCKRAPGESKLAVNPDGGVVVRVDVEGDDLTARHVPVAPPAGAEEPTRQPRVVVQEVEGGAGAHVVDERRALKVSG